ncbi:MAG: DnaD domain protein [Oscillospiraceae bacterium]|nr:DnaD domain protein [Oscillospiraceae bacterium]
MAENALQLAREDLSVAARRLVAARQGDAALLYLCLAERGAAEPDALRAELGWDAARLDAAARALLSMGLLRTSARAQKLPPPETALPEYSRADVMDKLESDASFAAVLREVERKLGRLSEPSVRRLLGLYDYLGLPADVILLLVNHCAERKAERFGADKPPTMRDVEKEGYAWAQMELFSHAAADAYLRREREKRARFGEYMAALGLGSRAPSPGEERYLSQWADWGFPPETVALAYDKTMLKCHELKWAYCNGILKRWHEKGLHAPDEALSENAAPRAAPPRKGGGKNAWMKDYA